MIVVVADDLTGAVELGGVALRYGLRVEVRLSGNSFSDTDLLVICTDTRSGTEAEAISKTTEVCTLLQDQNPDLVYKKVDSALRGHIIPEIQEHLKISGLKKALLVPANPAAGRVIEGGRYLINGIPINETGFRNDPEFPALSAEVSELLRFPGKVSLKTKDREIEEGITVAEVSNEEDLKGWTRLIAPDLLLGGGAAFFNELMAFRFTPGHLKNTLTNSLQGRRLLVSGTAYNESVALISSLADTNAVIYIPEKLLLEEMSGAECEEWLVKAATFLEGNEVAVIAFQQDEGRMSALTIRQGMADIVKMLLKRIEINELVIEGGATASAILSALNIESVFPVNEFSPGVVRSRALNFENLHVTLKPGSYKWPQELWKFLQKN